MLVGQGRRVSDDSLDVLFDLRGGEIASGVFCGDCVALAHRYADARTCL
ncbi:hypothetical protein [Mycolicibacterium sp.]